MLQCVPMYCLIFSLTDVVNIGIHIPMYIDRVPNRNSPPAILLREGWREDGTVRKPRRSLMLTHLCSYKLTHGMRSSFVCDEGEGIAG